MSGIQIIRPLNLFLVALVQFIASYLIWYPALRNAQYVYFLNNFHIAILIICTLIVTAAGYVINDYYDYDNDIINRPNAVVVGNNLSAKKVLLIYWTLLVSGLVLVTYLAFATQQLFYIPIYILACTFLFGYSKWFKCIPIVGNLIVALYSAVFHLVFVLFEINAVTSFQSDGIRKVLILLLGFGLFSFLISLSREIVKDIQDIKGDQLAGCPTLPMKIGIPSSLNICSGILIALLFLLFYWSKNIDPYLQYYALIFIVIPILLLIRKIYCAVSGSEMRIISQWHKIIMASGIIFLMGHAFI